MMCVPGGRLPTHRAWPDCLGFRGGPLSAEDVGKDELELFLRIPDDVSVLYKMRESKLTWIVLVIWRLK